MDSSPETQLPATPKIIEQCNLSPRPATSIPCHLSHFLMDSPVALTVQLSSSNKDEKRGQSSSDPPPYPLHEIKAPGDVTFIDPWSAPLKHRSDTSDSSRISPSRSINTPGFDPGGDRGYFIHDLRRSESPKLIYDARRLSFTLRRVADSELFWLALYFLFNLGLTLYNKMVLVSFPFPYTLTAMHALCGSIGCYVLQEYDYYVSGFQMRCHPSLSFLGSSKIDDSTSIYITCIQRPLCSQHCSFKPLPPNGHCAGRYTLSVI